jgi:glyoxylase-like metal-dependent hydrolase (beta-lactamase superfamily II)/rhodanese-related sulfurtransferase
LFFRQILYGDLGCASYFIACGGEAVVVDPRWDIDVYLELARKERFRIAHVIETHNHADHVSGRLRLVAATGAKAYRPDVGPDDRPDSIAAGDVIAIGKVEIRAIATPGHRPEHLSYEVVDHKRSDSPWMILTGDTLLVGDVARPDLAYEARDGAEALHHTLGRLTSFDDHVEIWPAHVGGSLCGGAGLSGKASSTVGFERRVNGLLTLDLARFVDELTATLPTRPPNVDRIVALNRSSRLEPHPHPPELEAAELKGLTADKAVVLDGRDPAVFDVRHLAGSVNLPVEYSGVGTRAGWAFDPAQRIAIVARDHQQALAMTNALRAVGFFETVGHVVADPASWENAGLPTSASEAWDLDQLAAGLRTEAVDLIDVRELSEWVTGHVRGSHHVPLHRLRDVSSVTISSSGRTMVVACKAGGRAAFAASLLRRAGRDAIRLADGGIPDLADLGIELELGAGSEPTPVTS